MYTHDVLIIGAGPAGVTAAYELAREQGHGVLLVEASQSIGGLARTVDYHGYRIDIGGHRFFSKSDWVMRWWREILPIADYGLHELRYQGKTQSIDTDGANPNDDNVLLVRQRLSRIYFDRQFFDYPLKANLSTAHKLGAVRCARFLAGYARARIKPIHPEQSLEDFLVNRFGRGLYETFFRDYTEKVWGLPCREISPEWGAQRIKSLSIGKALRHALTRPFHKGDSGATSLIEKFLYPKYGPGQMWERACTLACDKGVEVLKGWRVVGLEVQGGQISVVSLRHSESGTLRKVRPRHVISSMPVRDLLRAMGTAVPVGLRELGEGLQYRDFITVGLLYHSLLRDEGARPDGGACSIPDNWIYVQEPGVKVGRLQFFNNWSPWMVADPSRIWVGLEYFCTEGDSLWGMDDDALKALGTAELEALGIARAEACEEGVVIRAEKAYPGYFGTYARFGELRTFLDGIQNLYLVGRNGMHRYNNQDHSMLTARLAVEAIRSRSVDKSVLWSVNIGDDYHEEVSSHSDQGRAHTPTGIAASPRLSQANG